MEHPRHFGLALALLAAGCGPLPEDDLGYGEQDTVSAEDFDRSAQSQSTLGTLVIDGKKLFVLGLSNPPPAGSLAPSGKDALDDVVGAGINILKSNPLTAAWTTADLAQAQVDCTNAAQRGVHTWVNLRDLSRAQPSTAADTMLQQVVTTLRGHPGLGLWKGADEPWWGKISASSLRHAFEATRALDPKHPWVIIQAPRGQKAELRPYADVTDVHGVDVYPVAYGVSQPELHDVGRWASLIGSATPSRSVVMTLQVCFSAAYDKGGSGAYVMPTLRQERYMIYDAIINGARGLFFFGGTMNQCLNPADQARGWNWSFWNSVLKRLIQEIGPGSELYPALLHPGTGLGLRTDDPSTQVLSRQVGNQIWVMTARRGVGSRDVTVSGLPSTITSGTVYTEGRTIKVHAGAFHDSFAPWGVHVYRFAR